MQSCTELSLSDFEIYLIIGHNSVTGHHRDPGPATLLVRV